MAAPKFAADNFTAVSDDAALPDGAVLVSRARFAKDRDTLLARNTPLGVRLASSENPQVLGDGPASPLADRAGVPNSATAAPFPGPGCCAPGWGSRASCGRWGNFCSTGEPHRRPRRL